VIERLKIDFPQPCPESWDAMPREGRNRHCAQCSKTIHDLSRHTVREVDFLLRSGEEVCARGLVDKRGHVVLKPSRRAKLRRVLAAALASVALLFTPTVALAGSKTPVGKIKGTVDAASTRMRVIATNSLGQKFVATVNEVSQFKLKKLPPGENEISFDGGIDGGTDGQWNHGKVQVTAGKTLEIYASNPHVEAIVGVMSRRR
jgi:hypothetical protein